MMTVTKIKKNSQWCAFFIAVLLLLPIQASAAEIVTVLHLVNDKIVFGVNSEEYGAELWVSDGTKSGTELLLDINHGPDSSISEGLALSNSPSLVVALGELFFPAYDGIHGYELWKTDSAPEGTVLVKDITVGPEGTDFSEFREFNGALGFWATSPATRAAISEVFRPDGSYDHEKGRKLHQKYKSMGGRPKPEYWTTDGTENGTKKPDHMGPMMALPKFHDPELENAIIELRGAPRKLYIRANNQDTARENSNCESVGIDITTLDTVNIEPGSQRYIHNGFASFHNVIYFKTRHELWRMAWDVCKAELVYSFK